MTKKELPPGYVSLKEFGRSVGVGRTRLYELPGQGLPHIRHGTRIMVKPREGEAWLRGEALDVLRVQFDPEVMTDIEKAASESGMSPEDFVGASAWLELEKIKEGEG